MQPKYLVVAHIARAQGLDGAVEIVSLTDFPERFTKGVALLPSPPAAHIGSLTIENVEKRPKGLIFKFVEIGTREEAERIAGRDLVVPIEEAAELPQGEFWLHDIIGMDVYIVNGDYLGKVSEVLRTGSNDVYVVRSLADHDGNEEDNVPGDVKEFLIPATREVVKNISLDTRRILIDPIPGLLE